MRKLKEVLRLHFELALGQRQIAVARSAGARFGEYLKRAQAAGRWVLAQPVTVGPPYYCCVAVSMTSDATGPYNLYSLQLSGVPG